MTEPIHPPVRSADQKAGFQMVDEAAAVVIRYQSRASGRPMANDNGLRSGWYWQPYGSAAQGLDDHVGPFRTSAHAFENAICMMPGGAE